MRLARAAKGMLAWTLHRSGSLRWVRRVALRRKAVILMYHRVNDDRDPFFPALPSRAFEEQVRLLARDHDVVTLEELTEWLRAGANGPPRAALTFDDGYPDTHDVVLPILERHGVSGTVFLATGPPETGRPLWLDSLRALVRDSPAESIAVESLALGPLALGSGADRLAALRRLAHRLKTLGGSALDESLAEIRQKLFSPDVKEPGVLSWSQVRRLHRGGVRIGAHTHRHHILSRLSSEQAREEVVTSLDLIRSRVGHPARTFAYPNGDQADYTAENAALLAELGVVSAVTTRSGFATPEDDPLQLPRVSTAAPSASLFACRVAGLGSDLRPARPLSVVASRGDAPAREL